MYRKEIGAPTHLSPQAKAHARHGVYAVNFFVALHIGVIVYFQSSFLASKGFTDDSIGLVYAIGSLAIICGLVIMPRILARIGTYAFFMTLVVIEVLGLIGLSFSNTLMTVASLFLLTNVVGTLLGMPLDIFLEETTQSEANTGGTRGIFLTTANVAFVIAPAVAGYIVGLSEDGAGLAILFAIAGLVLTPVLPLALFFLRAVPDKAYQPIRFRAFFTTLKTHTYLRLAFLIQFVLRMFFAIMVIYTPLYLNQVVGLSFATIGFLSSIMVVAYVLLELPLGYLAERALGERGIMALGFATAALATIAIPFTPVTASVTLFACVLFMTRVGGAMIDITSEVFFFKQVDGEDTDDVSVFRTLGPLSYIVGPLLGSLTIALFGLPYTFIFCGGILLLGIPLALRIPKFTKPTALSAE